MTENVDLLEKWRVRYNELIKMDRTLQAEQVLRCINDFKGLQREAAGDGEAQWVTDIRREAEMAAMKTNFTLTRDELLHLTGSRLYHAPGNEDRGGGEADIRVGVDVTKDGAHVVVCKCSDNNAATVIYSEFHPAPAALDAERLDWLAHHGVSIRNHSGPIDPGWFLVAPYHVGIPCVDDHKRFPTAREAIDAARATTGGNGNG